MSRIDSVPRADGQPEGPFEASTVRVRAHSRVRRRGFLAVAGAGATTLGLTVLGWIPFARPARAEPGTEYLGCGQYGDGPGGPLCSPYPYSPSYCGYDDWFRNGCFTGPDGETDCYRPLPICEAGEQGGRNAWRWEADGVVWRCADGEVRYEGAPNPERVICNANLSDRPAPIPDPTPSPTPTTTEPPPLPLPQLPPLPTLPSLPVVPTQPPLPPLGP